MVQLEAFIVYVRQEENKSLGNQSAKVVENGRKILTGKCLKKTVVRVKQRDSCQKRVGLNSV